MTDTTKLDVEKIRSRMQERKDHPILLQLAEETYLRQWVKYKSITGFVQTVTSRPSFYFSQTYQEYEVCIILCPCFTPWSGWDTFSSRQIVLTSELKIYPGPGVDNPAVDLEILPEETQAMLALAVIGS